MTPDNRSSGTDSHTLVHTDESLNGTERPSYCR